MSDPELVRSSTECNPTVFSVFVSGILHKMNTVENVLYVTIVLFASFFNCICLTIVARSNVFHSNLQGAIWWTAFSYFELAASKLLIIAFQMTYLIDDNQYSSGGDFMITWSAATHYHFIFHVMASPIVVVVERSLATFFLFDYEKKKRRLILFSIVCFQFTFGALFTLLTVANILRYVPAALVAACIGIGSLLDFVYINKINKRTLRFVETQNRDVKFDLSVRYQLRENVKTFKMLKKLFVTLIFMIILIAMVKTIPMIIDVEESTKYTFREITDMIVHAGPIYITVTLILAVEDYRIVFFRLLGHEKKRIMPFSFDVNTKEKEEDVYFEQLMQSLK